MAMGQTAAVASGLVFLYFFSGLPVNVQRNGFASVMLETGRNCPFYSLCIFVSSVPSVVNFLTTRAQRTQRFTEKNDQFQPVYGIPIFRALRSLQQEILDIPKYGSCKRKKKLYNGGRVVGTAKTFFTVNEDKLDVFRHTKTEPSA